ncbi:unnamed protein product [Lymnaea stagnalis]|uniref:EF-hand domain-containing protein n=1 Tax=Lymnaea stagnalis TaxID=6523 RepID=A0AAV2I7X2_LYMST
MLYLVTILICLTALTQCQIPDINAVAADAFKQVDTDADGYIVRGELNHYFATYDLNHDGRVSRQEYTNHILDNYGHDPQLRHLLHSLYDGLDVNNDHHLDNVDYNRAFTVADHNGDNLVTPAEFTRWFSDGVQAAAAGLK